LERQIHAQEKHSTLTEKRLFPVLGSILRVIELDIWQSRWKSSSARWATPRPISNLLCFGKSHGDGVHAIAKARGTRAIVEDVAEVGVTAPTGNFGANHSEAAVDSFPNIFLGYWCPETGPSSAGVELGVGIKQSGVTTDAAEDSFLVRVRIFIGVRTFSGGVTRNFERIRRELLFPFGFSFHNPVHSNGGDSLADIGKFDDGYRIGEPSGLHFCVEGSISLREAPCEDDT
jgi:hypothetical protein